MKKLLFATAFMMTMSNSHAEAFTLSFEDLTVGTNVLNSYKNIEGITFTTGLSVTNDGAYENPDRGAMISGPNTVTMSIPNGTDLLSFYFNGSAILNAYDSNGKLFFKDTPVPDGNEWSSYAANFYPNAYRVDFVVSSGNFLVDQLTNEAILLPEPSTLLLLGSSMIGLAGTRIKKKK